LDLGLTETQIAHKSIQKLRRVVCGPERNTNSLAVRKRPVSLEANMSASPAFVAESTAQSLEPFVDADIAAAFLGITRRTLLQKVRTGKIPGHPLDPTAQKKEWRFKLSELDRFIGAPVNSSQQPT
jgi:hypothetical protein